MAWFFLSYLVAAAFTLISFLVMTRVLTPEEFGAFNVTILSATTVYFFVLAWIPTSIQRFHSAREFHGRASAAAFGTGAIITAAVLVLSVVALLFMPGSWRLPFLLGAFFWLVNGLNETGLAGLRVLGEGRRFAATVVFRPLIGTILAISLVLAGFGYPGAIVGMSIGAGLTGVYALVYGVERLKISWPSLPSLRTFARFGLPLAFVASSSTVVVLISQAFIARGPGLADVGIFAAAQTLALRGIAMPMSMLSNTVAASVFHAYEVEGDAAATAVLDRHFSFLMLFGLPIVGAMALSNQTVAAFLFDSPFREEVAQYLPILAVAAFLSGIQGGFYDYAFMISRRTDVQLLLSATTVAVHALLSVLLVWAFGTAGASWAVLATSVLGLLLYRQIGRRFRVQHIPRVELRKAAIAFLAFAPIALYADYLGDPLWSPLISASAGVAFLIVLALQGQTAMRAAIGKLARSKPFGRIFGTGAVGHAAGPKNPRREP